MGDYINKGQTLAFISINDRDRVNKVNRLLKTAFIVRKPDQGSENLSILLEQIKNRTNFAIREHDEELFERMMGAYRSLFDLYVDLPLPPSTDLPPELFRGWNTITNTILHLNEIIKTASCLGSDLFVSRLSYEIHSVAGMIILHADNNLNESLTAVLRLFVTMYDELYIAGNETGTRQSFYYLTGGLVDRIWLRKLQSDRNNLQTIQNLRIVLGIILRTNAELLKRHDLQWRFSKFTQTSPENAT